jgi:DNA-binding MarR family transcriptional regulator
LKGKPLIREALKLEAFLPYRLNVLGVVVSEGLARVYSSRFGLDIAGWRVIATLGQFGGSTAKSIGLHSHMHKTKVSRAVMDLEGRALVERLANPADRREAFLNLTPKGHGVYERIVPLAETYEAKLLGALDEADQQELDRLLMRLSEKAQQMLRDGKE